MNPEIEKYQEQRKKHFWEHWGIPMFLLVFAVGCVTTSPQTSDLPQPYNLTTIGNSSGFVEMAQLVNTNLLDGTLGILWLIAIFAITFTSYQFVTNNSMKAIAIASFVSFAMSVLLSGMQLVPGYTIIVTLVMMGISAIILKTND